MTARELREKRARLVENARELLDRIEGEGRTLNDEESRTWDQYMAEADQVKAQIDRLERLEDEERELSKSRRITTASRADTHDELRAWFLNENGSKTLTVNLATESRALASTITASGGATIPESFSNALEVALLAHDGMRPVSTVIRTTGGNPLPWPTTNDTANEGSLINENTAASEQDITFATKTFGAYKITSGIVRIPHELVQDAGVNIGQVVGELLGTRIGRALNKYHTTGTGSSQFEGAATAAASGVTGSTLGSITYDELVELVHSVDPAYRRDAVFVMNDATLAAIKKLKDSDNRPLWLPSLASSAPDTILGYRYVINQHLDDLDEGEGRPILFGNTRKFMIRDVADITIVRADERYFEYGQTAFVGWYRGDSGLLDAGTNPLKCFINAESET